MPLFPDQVPAWVKIEEDEENRYGKFVLEPLPRGFGTTLGNPIRRALLSSIPGSAITSVRVEGIQHEFTSIPGVKEDCTEILLNLKDLRLRLHSDEPKSVIFKTSKKGKVKAKDLFDDEAIVVFNPDQHVLTITDNRTLEMEITVDQGLGYYPSDTHAQKSDPIGTLRLDAVFSPVERVNITVENSRVGQMTEYDRLILEVWTNGGITPKEAVSQAADFLLEKFRLFIDMPEEPEQEEPEESEEDEEMKRNLRKPVNELELSVRSHNCLESAGIETVADLVRRSESEMLKFHNFGKKSLAEIKAVLDTMVLEFGMDLDRFPEFSDEAQEVPAEAKPEA